MSVELHHRLNGPDGAPVVMLSNALGSTMEMWAPQVPALATRFRVLRYDHRGHGMSPVPPGPYEIADFGRDALELLDRLEIERAHFCGLSLGGMTGMWLAANAPERVDRLVLLCTTAHFDDQGVWRQRIAAVREGGTEAVADAGMERWFSEAFREREPRTVARFRAMVAAQPAEGYAETCGALERMDLRPQLPTIQAPTLVIAGDDDPSTPVEPHARLLAERIPGARLEVVAARHMANVEQAEAVTALILEHLEQ